jgi:hypothetical protein
MLENINPEIWGPSFWNTMHYSAIIYSNNPTDEDKNNVKLFLLSLQNILPCAKCREHYKQNLIKYPLNDHVLSSKINLFKWTNDIHNEVNKMNNKKQFTLEDSLKKYSQQQKSLNTNIIFGVIIIIIILILYLRR